MLDQNAHAIGGPNLTPASDNPTAKCVSLSPGNPCHVMLDDQNAEHIPGCNMAFRRDSLLRIGGFDPRFRIAGDDVDICWRFLDANFKIAFAPSAVVYHHRRSTIRAYLRQQANYGRSESILHLKHPARFNTLGSFRWSGIIYGDSALTDHQRAGKIFHGPFGSAPYQIIYRQNNFTPWSIFTMLEWHLLALFIATLSPAFLPVLFIPAAMWLATLASALRSSLRAPLPKNSSLLSRPTIFLLHILQPIVRSTHRHLHRLRARLHRKPSSHETFPNLKRISPRTFDLYWQSQSSLGRLELLNSITNLSTDHWHPNSTSNHPYDLTLVGNLFHDARILTATENLGGEHRFTRARCTLHPTPNSLLLTTASVIWLTAALITKNPIAIALTAALLLILLAAMILSLFRLPRSIATLLSRSAQAASLDPYILKKSPAPPPMTPIVMPLPEVQGK
jgi:hypothetical protein